MHGVDRVLLSGSRWVWLTILVIGVLAIAVRVLGW